jgi:hypothetical protein
MGGFTARRFISLAVLVGLILPTTALPAAADSARAHTPFVTVLLRDWNRFDTNHDGELSVAEIDHAVLDPNVKGEDAALAGTLKLLARSTKVKVPPLTRQYFLEYDRQARGIGNRITPAAAEAATSDTVASATPTTMPSTSDHKLPINWDLYFIAGQRRIARGGGVAWPDEIKLDDLRQGPLGDCFLVATIGSMVVHRPGEVQLLIQPKKDGSFAITFPQAASFSLHPLTQAELVLSSTAAGEGVWLAALEQAFGQYREKQRGSDDPEGTDAIAAGGQPGAAMSALTGHKVKRVYFATTTKRREAEQAKMLPILRENLLMALMAHRLITASVAAPIPPATQPANASGSRSTVTVAMLPKIPPDINTKHAYAVLGYDEKTDTVEIWNPHGQSFKPKGPPGLENGYPTEHGRFRVPLVEAYSFITSFFFETADPATMPVMRSSH